MSIFISHSKLDDNFAEKINKHLLVKGIDTWIDHLSLKPGDNWDNEINIALQRSTAGLFLLSKNSAKSTECINEWRSIIDMGKTLYVALIETIASEDYPYRLRTIQYIDLTKSFELNIQILVNAIAENNSLSINNDIALLGDVRLKTTEIAKVAVSIETDFNNFNEHKAREIVSFIATLTSTGVDNIRIVDIQRGSVVLRLEMPKSIVSTLQYQFKYNPLAFIEYSIIDISVDKHSDWLNDDPQEDLYNFISALSRDQLELLFEVILTPDELQKISRRLRATILMSAGLDIQQAYEISRAQGLDISRVVFRLAQQALKEIKKKNESINRFVDSGEEKDL